MGALLKLLATIGQNWLFWSLMDLFLEEAGVWNWREDFGTRPLVEGGLEVYSCDDDAAFLVVDRRDDNTAWMRLVDATVLPPVFEQAFQALGLAPDARSWQMDLDVLDKRLAACDNLSGLCTQISRRVPGSEAHAIALRAATLATEIARFRLEAFQGATERERDAGESGLARSKAACQEFVSGCSIFSGWVTHDDPRGSVFTLNYADSQVDGTVLMPFNVDWSPAVRQRPRLEAGEVERYKVKATTLKPEVLAALSGVRIEGGCVYLTSKMSKKVYDQVNATLNALGGKWHTGKQAHVFDVDPAPLLDTAVETSSVLLSSDFEFFETQAPEVARLIDTARMRPGDLVLEPQAGGGALATAAAEIVGKDKVTCYELMPSNVQVLADLGFKVDGPRDFLAVPPLPVFDCVIANPPFSGGRDIAHITHALKFLKPGGKLTAIMSPSWRETPTNAAAKQFKALIEGMEHTVEKIDAGAFSAVGTQVATVLLHCRAPEVPRVDVVVPVEPASSTTGPAATAVSAAKAVQEQLTMF